MVRDNLSAHKSEAARTAIAAVGYRGLFLLTSSLDVIPIELALDRVTDPPSAPRFIVISA